MFKSGRIYEYYYRASLQHITIIIVIYIIVTISISQLSAQANSPRNAIKNALGKVGQTLHYPMSKDL